MLTILFERFICGWNGSSTKWNKNKHCVQYFHVLQTNARRKNWQQTNDENCQFDVCGLYYVFENWFQAKESNIIQHMLYRKTKSFCEIYFLLPTL